MPRTTQLTVSLKSAPGVLAQLARTLADARVNITSLSADAVSGRGKIRLIVSDATKAKRALKRARYRVSEEPAFVVRMQKDEAPVLQEYAVPLAHPAIDTLSKKYEFTPKGPLLIEIFPKHDDFAVRIAGLPGMIGALGVCFGRVVAMDSPRARPPGEFQWEATLWHELAHVVTLQMSKQRVPRWLTEGISVYEESVQRPEWGRDMETTFARAMDRGKVLKLKDLNAGFTRPERHGSRSRLRKKPNRRRPGAIPWTRCS